ncbi:hypothetical protein RJ640_002710 [Escallonia rubra]|uniref:Cystatin domain-containing protein n=1 Tax=Escallonia rubra TaxID=112253 RepID=A0AA88S7C8_9ASTE|nr:hypothetical protein RJ640_002710 [Escallonia rubra]
MTSVDWEKYAAQVEASDGFDVDEIRTNIIGLIHPIGYLSEMGPAVIASVSFLSRTAMDWYNGKNGSNYVFDKLVKANIELVAGGIYYITYEAKDAGAGPATTFQARVFKGIPKKDGTPNVIGDLQEEYAYEVWRDGTGETDDDGNGTGSGRAEVDDEEGRCNRNVFRLMHCYIERCQEKAEHLVSHPTEISHHMGHQGIDLLAWTKVPSNVFGLKDKLNSFLCTINPM